MERIEYRQTAGATVRFIVLCALFVALGIFMVVTAHDDSKMLLYGILCIVFFAGCGVLILRNYYKPGPRIALSDEGLYDRGIGETIPWSLIQAADIRKMKRQKFICLTLKDEEERLAKRSARVRAVAASNRALGFTAFSITASGLGVSTEDLLAKMQPYMWAAGAPAQSIESDR